MFIFTSLFLPADCSSALHFTHHHTLMQISPFHCELSKEVNPWSTPTQELAANLSTCLDMPYRHAFFPHSYCSSVLHFTCHQNSALVVSSPLCRKLRHAPTATATQELAASFSLACLKLPSQAHYSSTLKVTLLFISLIT